MYINKDFEYFKECFVEGVFDCVEDLLINDLDADYYNKHNGIDDYSLNFIKDDYKNFFNKNFVLLLTIVEKTGLSFASLGYKTFLTGNETGSGLCDVDLVDGVCYSLERLIRNSHKQLACYYAWLCDDDNKIHFSYN